ncbi:hypothetical protein ES705_14184 [subsurface metagenome]
MLLVCSRQITRQIDQGNNRDIKRIAVPYKSTCFIRRINIKNTGQHNWLVCNKTNGLSFHTAKSNNNITCPSFMYLEKIRIIRNRFYHITNIIWLFWIIRNNIFNFIFLFRIFWFKGFCFSGIIPWYKGDKFFYLFKALGFTFSIKMSIPCNLTMHFCPSKILHRNFFAQYSFDYFRTGNKHFRYLINNKNEIG